MKRRLVAVAIAALVSVVLAGEAKAAPPATPPGRAKQQQGVKNAKKVVQFTIERDQQTRTRIKKGQAARRQAQHGP